jgi:hypothetical protein
MLQFFEQRGISAEVLERNGVCSEQAYNPATKQEERVIAFPYTRWVGGGGACGCGCGWAFAVLKGG